MKPTTIIHSLCHLLLAASTALALSLTGCDKHSPDPIGNAAAQGNIVSPSFQAPPEDAAAVAERAAAIKREAYQQLLPVIRRFERRRRAYAVSEQEYKEKLYLWSLTVAMLEVRSNPGNFAGDLPEHELFAYQQYVEAAEDTALEVSNYLDRRATESDPEVPDLRRVRDEAAEALTTALPSSGSRLADAINTMSAPDYKAIVNASNSRLAKLAVIGGGHVGNTAIDGTAKAMQYLNSLLSH